MNEPLILIGSKGRPHLPCLKWIKDPIVVVEPQDEAVYREQNPTLEIIVMPENDRGFAYMMNQLVEITLARGKRFFIFSDDDVFGLKARPTMADKFTRPENVREVLQKCVEQAEAEDLAQLAISFSGQSWGAKKAMQYGFGAWGVHITDARKVKQLGGFDEKLVIFNDWEMSARLLSMGFTTARTNLVTFEHKMKSMEGGAAGIYKMPEKVKEAAERLARRYPGVARTVYHEEHGLWEVRFNWKALRGK